MSDDYCARCGRRDGRVKYRPVPLWLRICAFPMIIIVALRKAADTELSDEYCPDCRPRQIFCYVIVGIWSLSLVGFLLWEALHGRNPFAR